MSDSLRYRKSQSTGASFEKLFEMMAARHGLWAEKNHLASRRLPGGRLVAFKSRLDFNLMDAANKVAFVDLKAFGEDSFTFSMIKPHQLELSLKYESRGFISGFVVWLKKTETVSFFSGHLIRNAGPRSNFTADKGRFLGEPGDFNPARIFFGGDEH